jgi:hypothetical protein
MVNTEVDIKEFATPEGKEWIKGLLHDEVIKDLCITFIKKDGTERHIRPTLIESRIPSDKHPKTEGSSFTDEAVRVFDTEIQEWRSFRFDSIKRVNFSI